MNPIFAAAHDLQAFCAQAGWHFCFIGGIAVTPCGSAHVSPVEKITWDIRAGVSEPRALAMQVQI